MPCNKCSANIRIRDIEHHIKICEGKRARNNNSTDAGTGVGEFYLSHV